MELIDKIADNLYQNIASKFGEVNIADKDASSVLESEQARLFDFNFVVEGENYGAVTISIIDPKNFTVYFNEGLSGSLPESIQDRWFDFLKEMRQFAKRHMMNFDVRNIGKNQLDKRDYEAISKNSSQYTTDEITMESVSKLFGSTKTSYQTVESARIIIKHRTAVDEDKAGSRSRQIQSVYIENSAKERFKFPFKYLPGARAMARHISAGGNPHDDLGKHIIESVKEMYDLKNFVSKLQRADGFVHEDASEVIHDAKKRYQGLKSTILTLGKTNGYKNYAENFQPTEAEFDESEIDSLKTKLVRQVDQSDLTDVLPSVIKAQRKVKEDASALNDYLSGKKKFEVKPDEEEDALIKKNLEYVKKTKQVKLAPGDHTENPIHGLIRRILVTLSKRTTDDELARAIFNIDTDFTNQRDLKLATAIASKWLKGDIEISPVDPRFKVKQQPAEQFENWTKEVMREGTWHLPSDESEVKAFAQVMSKPIPVGDTDEPGTGGATDIIGKFFGDDELYDEMYVVHQKNGEEADARPAIYAWLKKAAEAGYEEPHDSVLKKMVQAVNPNFDTNYNMSEKATPVDDDDPRYADDENLPKNKKKKGATPVDDDDPRYKDDENLPKNKKKKSAKDIDPKTGKRKLKANKDKDTMAGGTSLSKFLGRKISDPDPSVLPKGVLSPSGLFGGTNDTSKAGASQRGFGIIDDSIVHELTGLGYSPDQITELLTTAVGMGAKRREFLTPCSLTFCLKSSQLNSKSATFFTGSTFHRSN